MGMKINLSFLYLKENKYSINSLLGSIDEFIGNEVEVFLIKNAKNLRENINFFLNKGKLNIIGFSFCTPKLNEVKEFLQDLRKYKKNNLILIAGGPHPSAEPEKTLKLGFDFVFMGEAEKSFYYFIKFILEGKDFSKLKGVCFYDEGGKLLNNGMGEKIILDEYFPFSKKLKKFGPVEISRGCRFSCKFCQTPLIFGKEVRERSIEFICEIVSFLKKNEIKAIRFLTPDGFSYGNSAEKIEELLFNVRRIIGKEGKIFYGTFPSEVRPENVNEEKLKILKKYVNNDNLIIGAQSGSEKILSLIKRGHKKEDYLKAAELCLEYGFKPNLDFIIGFPFEEEEDLIETINTIDLLIKKGARIHLHYFLPLPKTPLANKKPKSINEKIKKYLLKLTSKGLIYGEWQKQEKLAKEF